MYSEQPILDIDIHLLEGLIKSCLKNSASLKPSTPKVDSVGSLALELDTPFLLSNFLKNWLLGP